MNAYEQYIHKSRYARYRDGDKRRETWEETVDRYIRHVVEPRVESVRTLKQIRNAVLNREIMPSMRALMTAGEALDRDNVAGYNCAYLPIDDRRAFDEIMYILMCGTGVGFSVERCYIDRLPTIADEFFDDQSITIHVADSRIGWATAYRKLVASLYDGFVPIMDTSTVRPAGARLRTFGGRASGPEPLVELFNYTITLFKGAAGRKLNELEVHDLVCKIASVIVAGGVRRSALISLSNATSDRLRHAKNGQWYTAYPHRALANNSVAYTERPDVGLFLKEWRALIESKSGERGIFNRAACDRQLPDRRESGHEWGTNPCSEIVLRPRQFCNLTEVVIREDDSPDDVKRKVELATILGTVQSTYTSFRYLGSRWRSNCEEERLLGVSLTGIMDNDWFNGRGHDSHRSVIEKRSSEGTSSCIEPTLGPRLAVLRAHAVHTNKRWARKLGINPSAAITCVKPSGTVSQLVGSASGIHPRYAKYYIRRVRNDFKDPLTQVLIDQGVPYEIDNHNPAAVVFEFPVQSPDGSVTVGDTSAIEQLELWKQYAQHFCEHKPSVSIYVSEDEWIKVADWVYDNFDLMSGVSFFPKDDHVYPQAPYEAITQSEYNDRVTGFPASLDLDFAEDTDETVASQELACQGGACEL